MKQEAPLPPLNLPPADLRLRRDDDLVRVYDRLRHKYVALTPEEFVRQHFIHFLIGELGYKPEVMANEVSIKLNDTARRCDTVVFGRDLKPCMIVEFKAPSVPITQAVFDQIVRYNMVLRVDYLVVSNGLRHFCCKINYENFSYTFLPEIPTYAELKNA